ncbi:MULTISPECIES: hypothetical protein [Streptomyces]|uniref:Uncharacterized protein n=1 Tax=Streptomyces canarius TaxID=285453 RepID=A0ABQ3CNX6_9ACTN|nr:hypothetical protein [Streptomyces canarius]GHA20911.1 hypothetical protein GCM10010345_27520 [Streptomyces canarius]
MLRSKTHTDQRTGLTLLCPGDPGHDDERTAEDVVAAVRYAAERGPPAGAATRAGCG